MKLSFSFGDGLMVVRPMLVVLGEIVTGLMELMLERMVTGLRMLEMFMGLVTIVTVLPESDVSVFRFIKSEGSKGSMSMSSSTSSPRLSNMFVPVELASAPTIALKQVTLANQIKFW